MTNRQPLLQIKKAFRQFVTPEGGIINALDGIDLTIDESEFITLLGPSGCGKTTLLNIIAGFETLDAGDIALVDESLLKSPAHKRPVNTVFQSYALFPHLSVGDNVGYGLDIAKVEKNERNKRVAAALTLVGLSGIEARSPEQLSGGQKQRVALARAIINRPKILLLDEPLSALDKNLRLKMQYELKMLQRELGICFIFVTHDQEEALTMSDRVVVLNGGKIEQVDAPAKLYNTPKSRFVAEFVGESNLFEVTITKMDDTSVTFSSFELGTEIAMDQSMLNGEVGDTVDVLLRPEHLFPKPTNPDDVFLDVQVTKNTFVGTDFQVVGELDNGKTVKALVRDQDFDAQIGERLRLFFSRSRLHIIPNKKNP
ncbi:ABC transporter ATP-binding protein [Marinomonas balearica]|uniref:Spermidine/putrescine import ATP-binding protein PotA n=1 Tax=Marinomonas balearica TaxID=491947 RepID=A0A4R6MDX5_9GAMM|nr:ABC transporter ATP-binding protein [Marinomonas balearica]TDO99754.1 spermidine/putrescine transport system ATP-binding protein [Marinomonas balearica]